ncbi:MAG: hypothetical protein IH946_09125 [Bacteroidetes bacterium]|nr:hypothetical protein [Bacteroidota bacterium]
MKIKIDVKGKHYKECEVCGQWFYGRRNQKYHYKCKVKKNNERAALRREQVSGIFRVMSLNNDILKELYPQSLCFTGIHKSEFKLRGFKFHSHVKKIRDENDGQNIYLIFDSAFKFDKESQLIYIYSKDDLRFFWPDKHF